MTNSEERHPFVDYVDAVIDELNAAVEGFRVANYVTYAIDSDAVAAMLEAPVVISELFDGVVAVTTELAELREAGATPTPATVVQGSVVDGSLPAERAE